MPTKETIVAAFKQLQIHICDTLAAKDGKEKFHIEEWQHHAQGGGVTRILQNGNIIEKGGVNFSAVGGELPSKIATALQVIPQTFFATGISIVLHPCNPFVPIIHMNVRYFELADGTYWFGGGIDVTPHYIIPEQATFFHTTMKQVVDAFQPGLYTTHKQNADNYFYIPHRNETRGIGGTFFDRLTGTENYSKQDIFEYCCNTARTFPIIYTKLMDNHSLPFTPENKKWQLVRRGRYVEFNLVYDKGTKFGLDTNGRIESILMSLPSTACWEYNYTPAENSPEYLTQKYLKKDIDWIHNPPVLQ